MFWHIAVLYTWLCVLELAAIAGRVWQWTDKSWAAGCTEPAAAAGCSQQQVVQHDWTCWAAWLVMATDAEARPQLEWNLPPETIPRPHYYRISITKLVTAVNMSTLNLLITDCYTTWRWSSVGYWLTELAICENYLKLISFNAWHRSSSCRV